MVTRRRAVAGAAALLLSLGALAFAGGAAPASAAARSHARPLVPATGLPAGVMPTRAQAARARAAGGMAPAVVGHLTYQGGPVIPNALVQAVWWGTGTFVGETNQSTSMESFLGDVLDSGLPAWLDEYHTPGAPTGTDQPIDYGTYLGATAITPSSNPSTITDTAIQSELVAQVNAGHLAPPFNDGQGHSETIYAVFFPAGKTICMGTDCSNAQFCAYHGTTTATVNGMHLEYMVLPDSHVMGTGCGLGGDVGNEESYTSHELVETITDPLVGINTLSWYDNTNGEIGDLCNAMETTIDTSFTVQQEWSNAANTCLATKTQPAAPTDLTAAPAPGGKITLSWTASGSPSLSEYVIYQTTASGQQGRTVATVPAGTTTWTSSAQSDGNTYYFEVAARNTTGISSPDTPQVSAVADSTAPSAGMTGPSSTFQLSNAVHVGWAGSDSGSGVATYDVQERTAAWNGGLSAYTPVATGTTATTKTVNGSPGHEYCFRARSTDHAGNVSSWSADRCTAIPLDERQLTASAHWSHVSDSKAYHGTLSKTTTSGAKLTLAGAQASRVALVVKLCSGCGKVGIYVGPTLLSTASTASSHTAERVLVIPTPFILRTATVTVKSLSAKPVWIDGLGVSHS